MVEQPSPSASVYSADDEESPSPGAVGPPCTIEPSPDSNETDDDAAIAEVSPATGRQVVGAARVAAAAEDAAASKNCGVTSAAAAAEDAAAETAEASVLVNLSPAQAQVRSVSPQNLSPPLPVQSRRPDARRLTEVTRELSRLKRLLMASEAAEKEGVISKIKRLVFCAMG